MALGNLGLHKLESYRTMEGHYQNSFFLKRNYLNYLIFPPQEVNLFKDIFISKGGVGKQIVTSKDQLNHGCNQTFTTFGAAAVFLKKSTLNHVKSSTLKKFKTELWGEDFYDQDFDLSPFEQSNLNWFRIYHQGKYFLVTDENIILKKGAWIQNPNHPIHEEDKRLLEELLEKQSFKIDYLIPRLHDGEFYLQKLNSLLFREKLSHYLKT